MYRIIVVEDQDEIRQELKQLLENALYEVSTITKFENVALQIQTAQPDLVLLDVNLPGENGISICTKLRQQSDVPIIFVTGNNTSMDELNCIMQGGDDYITKPYQAPILLARIAAVLKRTARTMTTESTSITYQGVTLDIAAGILSKNDKQTELTKNELKILHCLMKNQGKIVSRMELIEYLWDNEIYIDDNTLSVNMTRLRARLNEVDAANFIETKRGMGYKVEFNKVERK